MMLEPTNERVLEELAILNDPVRRGLYLHVLDEPEAVSRDAAAEASGVSRALAAFHLDRLVEAGLLVAEFRRLGGRSGPGAGRPSKLYRPSGRAVRAVLPQRRFEVAAELFAAALSASDAGPQALNVAAEEYGRTLGLEARRRAGSKVSASRVTEMLSSLLRDAGYSPFERDDEIRLRNCPFHELAQHHLELTCGMNLALLRGLVAGTGIPEVSARLDPTSGLCCVAIGHGERLDVHEVLVEE